MISLTILDAAAEREWLADDAGVFTFTRWCEVNELPITALVSGSIEVLDTGGSATIRYGAYQPDPAGGWARGAAQRPLIVHGQTPLVQRLPRHVRVRRLVEQDPPAEPAPAAEPEGQLIL